MKNKKRGQVALVVLFIMAIMVTIGLSLISRSISDIDISKDEEQSMRAFSAAEAGIEEAFRIQDIQSWVDTEQTITIDNINVNIDVQGITDNPQKSLSENEYMNIDLTGIDPGNPPVVSVSWDNSNAAVEILLYNDDSTTQRYTLKGAGASCVGGFDTVADPQSGQNISIPSNCVLMRIKPICNSTTVQVAVESGTIPTQEYKIDSKAAVGPQQEQKTKRITATKSLPALPPIFDYVLFTNGGL